ncbi:hypothetical protein GGTG_07023 [Gaeumannomyces tritici R3-111a-1]|uniref:AAA+ ATPase domain-containing protein n=1 Tax=Gaeumannomyces tritici (strain R3-111a-1) TaxID=644352 RepID=J3P0H8_GAET3|nr:hypothetical protein GGTG_07023 [Gaeumannomyces tritici R3-111a-1]EJT77111.1 hypothetical protein GGTG_07023 [Gaeumannomyces tritici R3-111a-1]
MAVVEESTLNEPVGGDKNDRDGADAAEKGDAQSGEPASGAPKEQPPQASKEPASEESKEEAAGASQGTPASEQPSGAKADDEGLEEGEDKLYLDTIPSVRRCGWIDFKNRFQSVGGGREHAVDVLNTSADLEEQMDQEHLRRMTPAKQEAYRAAWQKPVQRRHAGTSTSELTFERVRINSSIVLSYLADVSDNQSWPMQPHTFLLPFAFLIHHHQAMNDKLDRLREEFGTPEPTAATGAAPPGEQLSGVMTKDETLAAAKKSHKAYQDMKCYVDFVAGNLMPHYNRFKDVNYKKPKKIRFEDLWSLFRYGELVCYPNRPDAEDAPESKARRVRSEQGGDAPKQPSGDMASGPATAAIASVDTHTILRVKFIFMPMVDDESAKSSDRPASLRSTDGDRAVIMAFYLDHDGTRYGMIQHDIYINYFRGEMDIHKLPVFPVRFLKNKDALFDQLLKRGKKFKGLLEQSRSGREMLIHDGWSLTRTPLGAPVPQPPWGCDTVASRRRVLQSEYLDTEIIIDFKEAFQNIPSWKPNFRLYNKESATPSVMYDSCAIYCWEDERRSGKPRQAREILVTSDNVDIDEWNSLAKRDPFIDDPQGERGHTIIGDEQVFREEDLMLLPARVMAYSLRDRKFFQADVENIKKKDWPEQDEDPFHELRIKEGHKEVIKALVEEHFDKKRHQELPDQDLIRGKGKGLVMLLHGAPGVGKTMTAEAIAQTHRRPLFFITCGDLGVTPDTVEDRLKDIFRLANRWDCILLLDEAEIFLSQRMRGDGSIQRNAMVSVFLRILEYYPGILFLTTNRVGTMDEAVKSRVHVSLHYPGLGRDETLQLFKMNIKRLKKIEGIRALDRNQRSGAGAGAVDGSGGGGGGGPVAEMDVREKEIMRFAGEHYDHNPPAVRWNGRQIRNAFQIAASLAHNKRRERDNMDEKRRDAGGGGGGTVKDDDDGTFIGRTHFRRVQKITAEFDTMRAEILKKTDAEGARDREERVDPRSPSRPRRHDQDHKRGGGGGGGGGGGRYYSESKDYRSQGKQYHEDGYYDDEKRDAYKYGGGGRDYGYDDDDYGDDYGDDRRERRDDGYSRRRTDHYSPEPRGSRRSGYGGNARDDWDRDRDRGGDLGSRKQQRARSRSGSRSRSRDAGTQQQQRKAGKSSGGGGGGAPAADDAGDKSRDRSRARGGGGDSETAGRPTTTSPGDDHRPSSHGARPSSQTGSRPP